MPSSRTQTLVYWDSDVILKYLDPATEPSLLQTLDALLESSDDPGRPFKLVTSTLAITEVAFTATERQTLRPDPAEWARIQQLWNDGAIQLAEFYRQIAEDARDIVRESRFQRYALKPKDAMHLATAKALRVHELHTFDRDLLACNGRFGYPITTPNLGFVPR